MSLFPRNIAAQQAAEDNPRANLPLYTELAYDFERNELLIRNGRYYTVSGNEALKVWIYKALRAQRWTWPAYTNSYGQEITPMIGSVADEQLIFAELRRLITECLMVNPYLQALQDFSFDKSGTVVTVWFTVITIYGRLNYQDEVVVSW